MENNYIEKEGFDSGYLGTEYLVEILKRRKEFKGKSITYMYKAVAEVYNTNYKAVQRNVARAIELSLKYRYSTEKQCIMYLMRDIDSKESERDV